MILEAQNIAHLFYPRKLRWDNCVTFVSGQRQNYEQLYGTNLDVIFGIRT